MSPLAAKVQWPPRGRQGEFESERVESLGPFEDSVGGGCDVENACNRMKASHRHAKRLKDVVHG